MNPEFLSRDRQDSLIMSWLLTTVSDSILSRVITCRHSFQVWNEIHSHFHALTRAKTTRLRLKLRTIKKATHSCNEYLECIQSLVHVLASIGDPVSSREHIDTVLGGLPSEYDGLVSTITAFFSCDDSLGVSDIETMLLAYQARLDQAK